MDGAGISAHSMYCGLCAAIRNKTCSLALQCSTLRLPGKMQNYLGASGPKQATLGADGSATMKKKISLLSLMPIRKSISCTIISTGRKCVSLSTILVTLADGSFPRRQLDLGYMYMQHPAPPFASATTHGRILRYRRIVQSSNLRGDYEGDSPFTWWWKEANKRTAYTNNSHTYACSRWSPSLTDS